ncbi:MULTISPECIES: cobyrinate a,c-diamide synthase [Thiorhodovibrio]|uniref:cobyrinate a,c-diamide synthase n=1 Tax=Thiorhodovibrio TaxID=61593 RepID=UPI0019135765|nr:MULTISPECIES: cobyrinate a,c-diamide synthase [Thiorhodovibrio]MBK5970693.1 cobyrinic acid a,c-diamide synthase [Thiorhodovibrio winogradskyi]WPL14237.1 Cobyrinic acid A,C-diamide synthase [Thiorhodovibrio litoralis]
MTTEPVPANHCPALLLAATASGQGKTSLTAALASFHHRAGRRVRVFKTGPDFLDPMILAHASGASDTTGVEPLDLWMVGEEECRRLLFAAAAEADLILIEGAMGLFDGEPSAADLAETFAVPVAALIDARGLGQTFGALALGLRQYRPGLPFAGVIGNRVGSVRHGEMIRAGLQADIPLLASLPRLPESATLPRRHLGLVQAEEIADLDTRLAAMADTVEDTELGAELDQWLPAVAFQPGPTAPSCKPLLAGRRIAVARDAAFGFLYEANLRTLRALGAELHFFSPLTDAGVQADALYLPGGYPELHLEALAANHAMQESLRAHVGAGRPIYAECGGMLYLLEHLADHAGAGADLVGLLPGRARMQPRLVGLGMQSLKLPAGELRGHCFHHSSMSTVVEPLTHGLRRTGSGPGEPFYWQGPVRASYLHLYFPSAPEAAASLFLQLA